MSFMSIEWGLGVILRDLSGSENNRLLLCPPVFDGRCKGNKNSSVLEHSLFDLSLNEADYSAVLLPFKLTDEHVSVDRTFFLFADSD